MRHVWASTLYQKARSGVRSSKGAQTCTLASCSWLQPSRAPTVGWLPDRTALCSSDMPPEGHCMRLAGAEAAPEASAAAQARSSSRHRSWGVPASQEHGSSLSRHPRRVCHFTEMKCARVMGCRARWTETLTARWPVLVRSRSKNGCNVAGRLDSAVFSTYAGPPSTVRYGNAMHKSCDAYTEWLTLAPAACCSRSAIRMVGYAGRGWRGARDAAM